MTVGDIKSLPLMLVPLDTMNESAEVMSAPNIYPVFGASVIVPPEAAGTSDKELTMTTLLGVMPCQTPPPEPFAI